MSDSGSSFLAGTGAGATASPPLAPPPPGQPPSTWGTPSLPRLIMDLRPARMLSCWMNQLPKKKGAWPGLSSSVAEGQAWFPRPSRALFCFSDPFFKIN